MEKLLTPAQVSEWTGLSMAVLAKLRSKGGGPKFRALTAKSLRYVAGDVEAWIAASERSRTGSA